MAASMDEAQLHRVGKALEAAGGHAVLVGGCVRDRLLGFAPKDFDIEVYGLDGDGLYAALGALGEVKRFGAAYAVQQVRGLPIDFTLPRAADFTESARLRDLTINSMGVEILSGKLLDPHGGRADLAAKRLRATDPETFGVDAVRGLRVCQLAARFGMRPEPALLDLCRALDLTAVPGERLLIELQKLLLMAAEPSLGLTLLRETGLHRFFPGLDELEDDAWQRTLKTVDEAARLRPYGPKDIILMLAALLHGIVLLDVTGAFLARVKAPNDVREAVKALTRYQRRPRQLIEAHAPDRAYRKVVRLLGNGGVHPNALITLTRARDEEPQAAVFARRIIALHLEDGIHDAVLGRHVMERGYAPGPVVGEILDACREVQDETGWTDPDAILDAVLKERAEKA